MELLEYQAKKLFQQVGIPVLPSQIVDHPRNMKKLKLPYPVVLKSQVHAGGRGKVGGIRFVANTIDAVAAAQSIFRLPIVGEYPSVLLAEVKYNTEREFYFCVSIDRTACRPVLLGSIIGGIDTEAIMSKLQRVVVEREFSPFYARRLALQMGLQGELLLAVSAIVEKMYALFVQKDLDLVEINPLGIGPQGEVMALDGKVTVNDRALQRHEDLIAMVDRIDFSDSTNGSTPPHRRAMATPAIPLCTGWGGNIGILTNSAGLAAATLDAVCEAGGNPGCVFHLGTLPPERLTPAAFCQALEQALETLLQEQNLTTVLVNLLGTMVPCDRLAASIRRVMQRHDTTTLPALTVRLAGRCAERAGEILADVCLSPLERLEDAVADAVRSASPKERV